MSIPARNIRTASPPSMRRWRSPPGGAGFLGDGISISSSGSAPAPMSAARKPRCWRAWRAAGTGAGEAAAARAQGPVRHAHRDQQSGHPGDGAGHPARRGRGLSGSGHGPVARDDADPVRRQYPLRRSVRGRVRRDPRRTGNDIGGGTLSGRPVRAVQVGGPLGAYFPPSLFDTPFDYEAFAAKDGLIGHGGIVVFDDTVDMARQARFAMEFCGVESCGKCTPCRIGSVRGMETVDKILAGAQCRCQSRLAARPLPHHEVWIVMCPGRVHPLSGAQRDELFPEDFRRGPPCRPNSQTGGLRCPWSKEID